MVRPTAHRVRDTHPVEDIRWRRQARPGDGTPLAENLSFLSERRYRHVDTRLDDITEADTTIGTIVTPGTDAARRGA